MALKTYVSDRKNLAIGMNLSFVNGLLSTSEEKEQEYIESLPAFKKEKTICLQNLEDVIAEAAAKAKELRAVADEAVKAAVEAEKALTDLKPKEASAKAKA